MYLATTKPNVLSSKSKSFLRKILPNVCRWGLLWACISYKHAKLVNVSSISAFCKLFQQSMVIDNVYVTLSRRRMRLTSAKKADHQMAQYLFGKCRWEKGIQQVGFDHTPC